MTLNIGYHRQRIEKLQHDKKLNKDVAIIISSKWWRKWYNIPHNKKLDKSDLSILNVDSNDLINNNNDDNDNDNDDDEEKENNDNDKIEISSTYLNNKLKLNLKLGKANDYIILKFAAYQEMIHMGYKFKPIIWVKNIEQYNSKINKIEKIFELYKTKYTIYYNKKKVYLLCSKTETIRKICTEIARYFVIQSSSIRLRYKYENGLILDKSHTLTQHKINDNNKYAIYVEIRLPNGCWPIKTNNKLDKKDDDDNNSETIIVCRACQRIINHMIDCPKINGNGSNGNCTVKYCNNSHLMAHWSYHELEHKYLFRYEPRWGLAGLENMGNTCYMNSSLQCLSYIAELRSYLTSDDYKNDINLNNPLGHKGRLANKFANFLKKMWFGLDKIVIPNNIRNEIGLLHSQWSTMQQQDAEEFIRWLLDGLHEDLNLILKKPYYQLSDSNGRNDEIVANEHWTLHLKRNQSIIVDLFQGQYKSTITCPSCNHKSVKFDAFSALSLPIPDKDTMISVNCFVFSSNLIKYPYKLTVNVSAKAVVTQLTNVISEKLNNYININDDDDDDETKHEQQDEKFCADNLLICRVTHNKFGKYWSPTRPIKKVIGKNITSYTYIYQVKTTTIAKRKENNLVQVRMNFCYKRRIHSSQSSGDSDDDYHTNNNNDDGGDGRIYFSHPIVFDILLTQFTGNNIYKYFKKRLSSFIRIDNIKDKIPKVIMYIKLEKEEKEIIINNDIILLTNKLRNVATINIEFSEYEYELFIDKNLSLINNDFNKLLNIKKPKKYTDIDDCLKLYTAAEVLDDVIWKCSNCNKQNEPSKQLHLWRLPEILIIHLKRFVNTTGIFGGIGRKNKLEIKTPIYDLDLKPYLSKSYDIDNIPKYDLFATVNHSGIMEFGHYYSCVRTDYSTQITNYYQHYNKCDPTWNLFNDDKVQQISINDLKKCMKDAYLLFYRRKNNV